jgi:hypothetical protein
MDSLFIERLLTICLAFLLKELAEVFRCTTCDTGISFTLRDLKINIVALQDGITGDHVYGGEDVRHEVGYDSDELVRVGYQERPEGRGEVHFDAVDATNDGEGNQAGAERDEQVAQDHEQVGQARQ